MAETAEATQDAQEQQGPQDGQADETSKTQVQSAEFAEAAEGVDAASAGSIDVLLDMDVPVTVAIGRREITIRRLLQLGPGSVIQLEKPIEAPADLYLKDTKFATGSIVIIDDRFAVRIKEIIGMGETSPQPQQE